MYYVVRRNSDNKYVTPSIKQHYSDKVYEAKLFGSYEEADQFRCPQTEFVAQVHFMQHC